MEIWLIVGNNINAICIEKKESFSVFEKFLCKFNFKTKNKSQKDLSVYDDNNINYDELEEIIRDKM